MLSPDDASELDVVVVDIEDVNMWICERSEDLVSRKCDTNMILLVSRHSLQLSRSAPLALASSEICSFIHEY